MTLHYRRDGTPYPPGSEGLIEWAKDFQNMDIKRVAFDRFPNGIEVSTVWLGLDHNFMLTGRPLIFESMIFFPTDSEFGRKDIGDQWRYSTEEEALRGHKMLVKKWRTFKTAEQVLKG